MTDGYGWGGLGWTGHSTRLTGGSEALMGTRCADTGMGGGASDRGSVVGCAALAGVADWASPTGPGLGPPLLRAVRNLLACGTLPHCRCRNVRGPPAHWLAAASCATMCVVNRLSYCYAACITRDIQTAPRCTPAILLVHALYVVAAVYIHPLSCSCKCSGPASSRARTAGQTCKPWPSCRMVAAGALLRSMCCTRLRLSWMPCCAASGSPKRTDSSKCVFLCCSARLAWPCRAKRCVNDLPGLLGKAGRALALLVPLATAAAHLGAPTGGWR